VAEFTGERVIPGKVDIDLWNEHISRYLFASRLCRFKKVIDLGCGNGYGSAELAKKAESVVGVDISESAIVEAKELYQAANLQYQVGSLDQLPFADGSFNLGVCFEVIEHLDNFRALLAEAKRVLAPGGQLIISTPNIEFYAESRKLNGPNPFHEHEFSYQEFRAVLGEYFDHQTFFVQNHASGLVFLPLEGAVGSELRLEAATPNPDEAHFFIAVCAAKPMMGAPSFVYVPTAANVLREREHHIQRLEGELQTKNEWLDTTKAEHKELVDRYRTLKEEIEAKNEWALKQNERVKKAEQEVKRVEENHAQVVTAYETRLREIEVESTEYVAWAQANEARLNSQLADIAKHIEKLDGELKQAAAQLKESEALMIERTLWAQSEQQQREAAEAKLSAVEASRWIRMGKAFGLGPKFS
jgi:SAM-dependent methyltransferase